MVFFSKIHLLYLAIVDGQFREIRYISQLYSRLFLIHLKDRRRTLKIANCCFMMIFHVIN